MRDPGRLHVITDEALGGPHEHRALAALASRGGADVVQFREKRAWSTRRLVETARQLVAATEPPSRLLVNDRVDVALASGAHGVHLGQDDLDPGLARRLLGEAAWIGVTSSDVRTAERLGAAGVADYLGVGPVFATRSKDASRAPAEALGLEGLAAIVRRSTLPVIAIGGLDPERARLAIAAGAWGVALLWDVAGRADALERVVELRRAIDEEVLCGRRRLVRS